MTSIKHCIVQTVALLVLFIAISLSTLIVHESEQAVITRFGAVVREIKDAGFYIKAPFIDSVNRMEKRIIPYDAHPYTAVTSDKRIVVIDYAAFIQITDPTTFLLRLKTMENALTRIESVLYNTAKTKAGRLSYDELVGSAHGETDEELQKLANASLEEFGVHIADLHLMRIDLPPANRGPVLAQMTAERFALAAKFNAEGERDKQLITSTADRDAAIIVANATLKAEIIRAEGDAEAARVYNEAYAGAGEFYKLYRSAEVLPQIVKKGDKVFLNGNEPYMKPIITR